MVVFCLLAGSLLVFAAYGVVGHLDARVRKHGPHALAWRWFSASGNWTGKAITNRGWTRPGTKALTPTGHAHRRWYLPRWQHALWRTEHTLAAVLLAFGLLLQPRRTLDYLGVTAAAGAAYGSWRAWCAAAGRQSPQELRQAAARPSCRAGRHPGREPARVVDRGAEGPQPRHADPPEGHRAAQPGGAQDHRGDRCGDARHGQCEAGVAVHRPAGEAAPQPARPGSGPGDAGGRPGGHPRRRGR